jgi:formylglycine-generating enzyme
MRSNLNETHARPDGLQAASRLPRSLGYVVMLLTTAGCSGPTEPPAKTTSAPLPMASAGAPKAELVPGKAEPAPSVETKASRAPACPDDMVYVDTTYCPDPELECLKKEHNKANKILICHEFSEAEQKCKTESRRQRFCMDRYEYPNKAGGHPPVMVDWYDSLAMCKEQGKRLCWESEWVSACEGPKKTPFPYGYKRDPKTCNIDNPWYNPTLDKIYSKDATIQDAELFRLDQSVSSGEMPGCMSGFGVHDQTGNVDEWVNSEKMYEKSKWAGLKGGAWGHVRNACRPMTVSHEPEFTYYFVSFRCCADASPDPEADNDPKLWKPPPQPEPKKIRALSKGWTPKTRGPHQPTPPKG